MGQPFCFGGSPDINVLLTLIIVSYLFKSHTGVKSLSTILNVHVVKYMYTDVCFARVEMAVSDSLSEIK